MSDVVELVRDWAILQDKDGAIPMSTQVRRKKPTLTEAEAWINQIVQEEHDRTHNAE